VTGKFDGDARPRQEVVAKESVWFKVYLCAHALKIYSNRVFASIGGCCSPQAKRCSSRLFGWRRRRRPPGATCSGGAGGGGGGGGTPTRPKNLGIKALLNLSEKHCSIEQQSNAGENPEQRVGLNRPGA
jgi:hypothetical protein